MRGGETETDGVTACEGGRKREWGRHNVRERERQWQGERERERQCHRGRERKGEGVGGGGRQTKEGERGRDSVREIGGRQSKIKMCMHAHLQ